MATKTVSQLVIDVATSADDAVSGMDKTGDAAVRMSKNVSDAGSKAEEASRKFAVTADGTDALASKSSVATGALGALSSGFELVGLEKYAGGLQAAALATDFMSGVGDSLTLVMEATGIKTAFARAKTLAYGAVTKTVAAGQWALNAALSANPIGLVIVAVVALIAGFVLLYKRSAAFRALVQAVGKAGQAAIGWVVSAVGNLVTWISSHLGGALQGAKRVSSVVWQAITGGPKAVVTAVSNLIGWVRDKLPKAYQDAKEKLKGIADAFLAPFKAVKDVIDKIINAISKIKIPHIPGTRVAPTSADSGRTTAATDSSSGGTVTINNNVSGAVDPVGTANTITTLQARQLRRVGLVTG